MNLKWSRSMNTTAIERTWRCEKTAWLQAVVQQVAVGQPGERVVVGLVLELLLVALALDRVLHRAQQQLAVELALDQVVLRAALHRVERELLVVVAGQHDDRHLGECAYTLAKVSSPWLSGSDRSSSTSAGLLRGEELQAAREAIDAGCSWNGGIGDPPPASRG